MLERSLAELARPPYRTIDVEEVVANGRRALQQLPKLMESPSIEERKELIQSLVERVVVSRRRGVRRCT